MLPTSLFPHLDKSNINRPPIYGTEDENKGLSAETYSLTRAIFTGKITLLIGVKMGSTQCF